MKDFPADVKLNSATLYLTATNRFAEEISSKFASYAIKQGSTSWSPPPVSSMTNWLPSLAEQWLDDHDSEDVILNRQHLQCHWMKFVLARPEGAKMLDVSGVAQSTFKAWLQCWQWGIALDAAQYASHDDWQLLVTWGNAFDRYLLENNITTEWHVAAKIIDKDGAWLVEFIGVSELVLVGFNKLPNRIQQLITMLAGAGVIVTAQEPLAEYEQALPSLYVCPDQNTELACVSEWCKAQLDENMQQKIAIVTPDLNSKRDAIARSLMQQIASDEYETGSWSLNPYFHFSNGQPFTAIAAVSHWFNAVKLIAHQIEFDIISTLLRANSLYSCTTEIQGRHQVDKHLRQSSKRRLSWKFVLSSLAVDCPRWHKFLIEIREKYRPSDQLSVAQYVAFMEEVTSALNWMAWPTKDSYSHQLTEQWFGQLQAFCQHVNRTETNTIDEWSRLLKYYVADAVFQPKFEDQPIQILGMLEGSLEQFDHVWLLGFDHKSYPSASSPTPFIPLPLQRELGLPNCDSSEELAFAKSRLVSWLRGAPSSNMSYSKRSNESDSLSVTPLLEVSPVNVIDVNTSAFQLPEVEYFNDTYTFEMNDADTKQHSGGTGLLRAFATCPFQAFARYRLGLKHWDEPDEGMTPQETGVANHRALELAWQEIGNSDALLALDDEKLNALCRRVVDEVERLYIHELYHLDAIVEIEKHRLYRSLLQWLTMEQAVQRSAFSVVATELEMAVTLNQFEFKFQIDRVDKTDTNEFIVIDYKSSQPKVKSLLSDDPDEWQLPLYVLGYSENVLAVSYGIVGTQKPKLIGIRDDTIHFKGLDSVTSAPVESLQSWPAITASWKTKISDMLTRYSSGYANVEPKNRSSSCLYCQFQTLCRIETLDQEECNG